ncbi:MAG: thiamine-phosphate kinase [Desulfurococcaceae archaeon]
MMGNDQSDLSEEEIVDLIARNIVSKPGVTEHLSYPEDARDLLPRAPRILFSLDAYSISSLKLPWRNYNDVGWSALTGAISDVIAKGGTPYACMVGLGIRKEMWRETLLDMIMGLKEASDFYNVHIFGGDTNISNDPWIAISVIGFTTAKKPPSRNGLKPGDHIVVTGIYGAMGYVAIHGFEKSIPQKWVIELTKRPRTFSEVANVISNNYKGVSASMDVSDGLGYTLETMSKLSGYGIDLFNPPKRPMELDDICAHDLHCIWEYVLVGGEEYGVVMGIREKWLEKVTRDLDYFKVPYSIIGKVKEAPPGVYINGVRFKIKRYDQFRGWAETRVHMDNRG